MNLQQLIKSVQNNLSYGAISDKEQIKVNQILSAMRVVDRQYFVPDRMDAYFDTAMPIGYNQTISQPSWLECQPGWFYSIPGKSIEPGYCSAAGGKCPSESE